MNRQLFFFLQPYSLQKHKKTNTTPAAAPSFVVSPGNPSDEEGVQQLQPRLLQASRHPASGGLILPGNPSGGTPCRSFLFVAAFVLPCWGASLRADLLSLCASSLASAHSGPLTARLLRRSEELVRLCCVARRVRGSQRLPPVNFPPTSRHLNASSFIFASVSAHICLATLANRALTPSARLFRANATIPPGNPSGRQC